VSSSEYPSTENDANAGLANLLAKKSSQQGVLRKSSCDIFCKQSQAAEISYFVESKENKKKMSKIWN
jgi:hypothetical protein